jgi:hypothetical protein
MQPLRRNLLAWTAAASPPAAAGRISGTTWAFQPNPQGVTSERLDFVAAATAHIDLRTADGEPPRFGAIGLDGVYRIGPGPGGLPAGWRGTWVDATTFVAEDDEIAANHVYTLTFHLQGERLRLQIAERTQGISFTLDATAIDARG